jgi:hypothetical protein
LRITAAPLHSAMTRLDLTIGLLTTLSQACQTILSLSRLPIVQHQLTISSSLAAVAVAPTTPVVAVPAASVQAHFRLAVAPAIPSKLA